MGAIGTRLSLRPLQERAERRAKLGQIMSRECGSLSHKRRHELSVVPAQAGTHNHKCRSLCTARTTRPVHNTRCGVWVPACAGTTADGAPPNVNDRQRCSGTARCEFHPAILNMPDSAPNSKRDRDRHSPPQCGRDISATTAERVSTPSFSKMWIRCVFTVARPMLRHSPISRLVRPQHNSSTTSISREVSP